MPSTKQLITTDPGIKKRLRRVLLRDAIILFVGVLYLIFVRVVGFGIPCVFYELTGLKCPGCGVSRMLVALSRLRFVEAFWHNPCLFVTGPFLLAYLACGDVRYIKSGDRRMGKWEIVAIVLLILLIAYGILRNIFPI